MMSGNWTTIDKSKRSSVKYAQSQEFLRSHLVFLGGKLPDVSSISQILSTKANIDPSNFHIEKFTHSIATVYCRTEEITNKLISLHRVESGSFGFECKEHQATDRIAQHKQILDDLLQRKTPKNSYSTNSNSSNSNSNSNSNSTTNVNANSSSSGNLESINQNTSFNIPSNPSPISNSNSTLTNQKTQPQSAKSPSSSTSSSSSNTSLSSSSSNPSSIKLPKLTKNNGFTPNNHNATLTPTSILNPQILTNSNSKNPYASNSLPQNLASLNINSTIELDSNSIIDSSLNSTENDIIASTLNEIVNETSTESEPFSNGLLSHLDAEIKYAQEFNDPLLQKQTYPLGVNQEAQGSDWSFECVCAYQGAPLVSFNKTYSPPPSMVVFQDEMSLVIEISLFAFLYPPRVRRHINYLVIDFQADHQHKSKPFWHSNTIWKNGQYHEFCQLLITPNYHFVAVENVQANVLENYKILKLILPFRQGPQEITVI